MPDQMQTLVGGTRAAPQPKPRSYLGRSPAEVLGVNCLTRSAPFAPSSSSCLYFVLPPPFSLP
eukprot:1611295-Pyramimonas_sp.AAC.1